MHSNEDPVQPKMFLKKIKKKKKKGGAGLLPQGRIKGKEFQVQRTTVYSPKGYCPTNPQGRHNSYECLCTR